jgi:hypothetical protein
MLPEQYQFIAEFLKAASIFDETLEPRRTQSHTKESLCFVAGVIKRLNVHLTD